MFAVDMLILDWQSRRVDW